MSERSDPAVRVQRLLTPASALGLGLILLLAVAARLTLAAQAPPFIVQHDSAQFFTPAYDLLHGDGFTLPLKRAPGYPAFLAGVIVTLGPSLGAVVTVQHLLGLGSIVMTYCLGVLLFDRPTGLLAAFGVAVNGSLLLMEHTVQSEAAFTPLLLATLLALFLACRGRRLWLYLAVGLLVGLGALVRPLNQTLLPLLLLAILIQRATWRYRLTASALVVVAFALTLAPWLLRNLQVNGIASISGGVGDSLFARLNKTDTGYTYVDRNRPNLDRDQLRIRNRIFELGRTNSSGAALRDRLQEEFPQLTEAQSDNALRDVALAVIRQEPNRYLTNTVGLIGIYAVGEETPLDELWESRAKPKYATAWPDQVEFVMEPVVERPASDREMTDRLTSLYRDVRYPLLIGALWVLGTIKCLLAGRHQTLWLLPLIVLSQIVLYAALSSLEPRYRYPFQPLITLVAAGGLVGLLAWLRARRAAPARVGANQGRSALPVGES